MYYHAHVYWSTPDERKHAISFRQELKSLDCGLGRVWDQAIGPHPMPMYQVNYCTAIQEPVEKLLESTGLAVLLHEDTGDDLRDHTEGARWLNQSLELNLAWLDEYIRRQR